MKNRGNKRALIVKRAIVVLAVATLLALAAAYTHRYTAAPAPRDHRAEFRALEDEAGAPSAHNDEAWADLRGLIERVNAMEEQAARAYGVQHAFLGYATFSERRLREIQADPKEVAASRQLAADYAGSDIPERLAALLADPTLGPPRLSDDGAPSHETSLDETLTRISSLVRHELGRLHHALIAGEHEEAAGCVRNALALARVLEQCPLAFTVSTALDLQAHLIDALTDAVHNRRVSPALARELVALLEEEGRDGRARIGRALQGEEIAFDRTLELLYAGELRHQHRGDMPPRALWASRADIVRRFRANTDNALAYLRLGPRRVGLERWDERFDRTSTIARVSNAPALYFMPAASRLPRDAHEAETIRGLLIVGLAVVVYESEHGTPPDTLEDLVLAGAMQRLPVDAHASGGRPFYVREPGAALGYRLYSVGPDLMYDSGASVPRYRPPSMFKDTPRHHDAVWTPAGCAACP